MNPLFTYLKEITGIRAFGPDSNLLVGVLTVNQPLAMSPIEAKAAGSPEIRICCLKF